MDRALAALDRGRQVGSDATEGHRATGPSYGIKAQIRKHTESAQFDRLHEYVEKKYVKTVGETVAAQGDGWSSYHQGCPVEACFFVAALGNTFVAKDLEQATRIAYGSDREFRRVVTLEGALFEKSGTMSGGGSKPHGGKMGTSIRMSISAEAIVAAKEDQLKVLRQRITDAAKCYQASEKVESRLEMELAKSTKEAESSAAEHSYIEKQLSTLKTASEPRKDELMRLKELENIISTEEKEVVKLSKCSSKLRDRATELQKKVEDAGGEALKDQKAKVSKTQSDIDKLCSEVNQQKVNIASGEKMIKKLVKSIEELNKEKENLIVQKEKMEASFKLVEQKAFEVQENYKKTQVLIDKHTEVYNEKKAEYNELKKSTEDIRATEVDTEFKLQDSKKLLKDWEMKVKGYKKMLDDIQIDLAKHMDQIQRDAVDPDKLQATLTDISMNDVNDLKRAVEMVALLEAQLKENEPKLGFHCRIPHERTVVQ
ncbi:hypothetical protein HPP92_015189 [Vanilla planifolia]|uniref:Uncharacterized protein n=1 Tax=Vanilla planifolia TaxID=51239 RepID=A0A835QVZ5_VANPL|nr:hypothetical protein HPP92_015189 [Vanilla planifolia]